jgi:2,3-bisphosphoglycerate-independent phosphoglycerate mutase
MVILTILDGWGHGKDAEKSALAAANTPTMDNLYQKYPNAELMTHGEHVGLPPGQMGNSEVGHLNIGAGRVVYQELARINKAIEDQSILTNPELKRIFDKAVVENKKIHLLGLVSDGGVHAHINHLKSLCDIANDWGIKETFIHAFLDGRDTDPKSGVRFIKELQDHIDGKNVWLASMIGRFYAMDRDNRWERIKQTYDLLVNKTAKALTKDPIEFLNKKYAEGITDEFMDPTLVYTVEDNPVQNISDGDIVLFINFRTDRPRELTTVLSQKDMPDYDMHKLNVDFNTMTAYDNNYKDIGVLYTKDNLQNTLGEVLSANNKTQVRIAETEKYPHVTFFFSGGREAEFSGESRILVNSPKVETYDLQPEMSALELTSKLKSELKKNKPDFVCLNFANTDMVGHTGVFSAAIKAAETVDGCLNDLLQTAIPMGYEMILIADHGNSDFMINIDGSPNTAHTTNPVPIILVGENISKSNTTIENGVLADVAPTILKLLKIPQPPDMTGTSLFNSVT